MNVKQNISTLILSASILALNISIVNAASPFENLPDDTLLVEVLGRKVYFRDIEPASDIKKKQQNSTADEQFKRWLKRTRASNLGQYFKTLLDNYVKEKALDVTPHEIQQFNEKMMQLVNRVNNEMKARKDSLKKELMAENLEDSKRADLEKKLNLYSRSHPEIDAHLKSAYQDANNPVSKAVILNWKIYKELYNQYRGRVIFQQAGPEPIDALRRFFEEQQSKGSFKFYNKDAEDLFWNYYRSTQCFYYDPNEAEQIMNTPFWLKEKEENYYDTEPLWGDEVNSLQIRIKSGAARGWGIFDSDKVPSFKMDILNTGDKRFLCAALEQFCEVEVDGIWYKWTGPMVVDSFTAGLKPKTVQYDYLEIKLNENWVVKEFLPLENKKHTLSLSLGAHIVKVKYKTMKSPEGPAIEVFSNSLKFKILPPTKEN